jgi:hypothetical protein
MYEPITVVVQSKAGTVSARSKAGVVASNPIWSMDVFLPLFCVCVVLCVQVAALRLSDPSSKESYRPYKSLRNWKTGKVQQRAVQP